jgi:hypothetical protein
LKHRKKKENSLFDVDGLTVDVKTQPDIVVGMGRKNPNVPFRK